MPSEAPVARKMPTSPPSEDSTTASTRNCSSTSRASAPMARRTPISRVRSVTLTSMMFMMPMPPTSRLTAATAPSSEVISAVVPDRVWAIWAVSSTLKLLSVPSASLRRSRSRAVSLAVMRALSAPSCIEISRVLILVLPVTRRCAVRSGTITVSSWSMPMAAWPLGASRPTIWQEKDLTRSCSPSGLLLAPKSSRCTVAPMTQTAAPAICSSSLKTRPPARFQLLVRK